jgi:hypothetical protein
MAMTLIDGRPRAKDNPVRFADLTRDSAWPPTRNGMTPLPYDDFPDTLLAQYIAASGSLEGQYHSLAVNLARLADKAASEYRAASTCLDAFLETQGVASIEGHTLLLRATSFLENCVDTVARGEKCCSIPAFEAMTAPAYQQTLKKLHRGVRDLRDSIQHADERITKGQITVGDPLFPAMTTDALYFAGEYVFYGEIASLVMHLWYLARAGVDAVEAD